MPPDVVGEQDEVFLRLPEGGLAGQHGCLDDLPAVRHIVELLGDFQCLHGENRKEIEKLLITASGGPFRGKTRAELENVTVEQALRHPNWSMGHKITIDSATLVNKGLEVMEAKWLFGVDLDHIQVVVQPRALSIPW